MRLRNKPRRGQATIIGGVMFLMIAMLLTGYLLEMFTVQREMNLRDVQANQERLEISEVFFGAKAEYTPEYPPMIVTEGEGTFDESGDPYFVIDSEYTYGSTDPLANGVFNSDAEGWYFTKSYDGINYGASGAYTTESAGSVSGSGSIYMDFTYEPSPPDTVSATMNWSAPLYFDFASVGVSAIKNITMNWGYYTSDRLRTTDSIITIYLVDSFNSESAIGDPLDISSTDEEWTMVEDLNLTSAVPASGWYTLVFSLDVTLSHLGSGRPNFRIYIDDVEVNMNFQNHVLDWDYTFTLNEDLSHISWMEMTFSSHYDRSVIQALYVIDQSSDRSILLSRGTMSDSDVKVIFPISGSDIQTYVSQISKNVTFRVYTVSSNAFQHTGATPTLKLAYTGTQDKILISLRNPGGVSYTVKSLWINDYSGHTQIEVDLRVSPGDIYTYQASHSWTTGEFTIKAITAKGSKAVTKATAK